MKDLPARTAVLIDGLTRDLQPIKRLRAPLTRAAFWLAALAVLVVVMAARADLAALERRLDVAPDMWIALIGSALTAITAAIATFQLSLPDRSPFWGWLPLPAAMVWIGASAAGCARTGPAVGLGSFAPSLECVIFVIAVSLPLSAVLLVMMKRGYALCPGLAAIVGGLAVASAAATLLNFFHPFDALAADLLMHLLAIIAVVSATGAVGARILHRGKFRPLT